MRRRYGVSFACSTATVATHSCSPKSAIEVRLVEIKKYAYSLRLISSKRLTSVIGVMGASADQYDDSVSESQGKVRVISGGERFQVSDNRWALLVTRSSRAWYQTSGKVSEALWQYHEIIDAQPNLSAEGTNDISLGNAAIGGISFSKYYTGKNSLSC